MWQEGKEKAILGGCHVLIPKINGENLQPWPCSQCAPVRGRTLLLSITPRPWALQRLGLVLTPRPDPRPGFVRVHQRPN